MASPQSEREKFEGNGCNSVPCKASKIRKAAKRIKDAKIPSSKVGKIRLDAMNRLQKQASKLNK